MANLLFSNNADLKYPLSDTAVTDIPHRCLTDLTLSVPPGVEPVLTGLRLGGGLGFVCFEDANTGAPVASLIVVSPVLDRIYPLTMDVEGCGWVVFGPGVSDALYVYRGDPVPLDPLCVDTLAPTGPLLELEINGYAFQVYNVLELVSLSDTLAISLAGNNIVLSRNDAALSVDQLADLQSAADSASGLQYVYTIGGIPPDENGNFQFEHVDGLIAGCLPVNNLVVSRGDLGEGVAGELPLDAFNPRQYSPTDPCGPIPESSSSGPEDPFDGSESLGFIPLLDYDNTEVGLLLTLV